MRSSVRLPMTKPYKRMRTLIKTEHKELSDQCQQSALSIEFKTSLCSYIGY